MDEKRKKKQPEGAEQSAEPAQPSMEEQIARRQSAPRPTAQDELQRMRNTQAQQAPAGSIDGFRALAQVIGREQILAAQQTLQKYKEGKANLERRIVENEQWFKLRHWECMRKKEKDQVEPSSGWLFNAIANKHADAMDNFPSPNVLPREEGDKAEAEMLSSILPVILDQADFEETYDNVWDYKLKAGTGIYGIFWDKEKLNGLGDISIKKIDIINLFWESGITDIQRSRNLFHVELADNDLLLSAYPQLEGKLGNPTMDLSKYVYDDAVDTNGKSAVVDWYYKKSVGGKTVLHYCKYVNDVVLFATENESEFAERGWYDHGQYPFVFDPLFSVEGTPCGFSYIDVGKSAQEYIDRGNQAIMENMLANSRPRHFIRTDGSVNEEEYADLTKDFIHVDGNLGQDSTVDDDYISSFTNGTRDYMSGVESAYSGMSYDNRMDVYNTQKKLGDDLLLQSRNIRYYLEQDPSLAEQNSDFLSTLDEIDKAISANNSAFYQKSHMDEYDYDSAMRWKYDGQDYGSSPNNFRRGKHLQKREETSSFRCICSETCGNWQDIFR